MEFQIDEFVANLGEFFTFFIVAVLLTLIFTVIYWQVTSHNEFKLIKEKSTAAAVFWIFNVNEARRQAARLNWN